MTTSAHTARAERSATRSPRLWSTDPRASWQRVGRLVDAHGILQTVMVQLTGGLFLTGFALALGADELLIGVLAALPLGAKLAQLYLSWRIEKAGQWRSSTIAGAVIGRLPLLALPLLALSEMDGAAALAVLSAAVAISALGGSAFELAFLTWMAELIPEPLRGVFWGKRWQIAGAVGIVVSLLASWLLGDAGAGGAAAARIGLERFAIVFGVGAVAGIAGILFLRELPEPRRQRSRTEETPLLDAMRTPLADANFRALLGFNAAWSLCAGFMAPFYTVYMLRELGLSFLTVSILAAIVNVLMSWTQPAFGKLGDRFGTKPVLRIGTYLITVAPLLWLLTEPGRVWPIVIVQLLSGLGWSAHHVSIANLSLKLAPDDRRPSYLASFGASGGVAEAVAPIAGGAVLAGMLAMDVATITAYKIMIGAQFVLFALATLLPRWVHEPGGHAVGHLIRVIGRYSSMDPSHPVTLLFSYAYTHLARLADLVAREFPRDAERI